MSQVCYTVTWQEQIPGTGIFVLENDESWESHATSVETPGHRFRYSFDPKRGNAYFSGIYNASERQDPLPEFYIAAFEVQDRNYRFWVRGRAVTGPLIWFPGDRFHIQYVDRRIMALRNDEVIWR